MRKTLSIIHRALLTVGVLVALTPCGYCQKHSSQPLAKAEQSCCSGATDNGSNHCGSQSASPFCQIMDQSSVPASSVHVDIVALPVISALFSTPSTLTVAVIPSAVRASVSPPRGPLSLRI